MNNKNDKVNITVWAGSPDELAELKTTLSKNFGGATFGHDKVATYDTAEELARNFGTESYYNGPRIRPIDQASENPSRRQQFLTTLVISSEQAQIMDRSVSSSLDASSIAKLFASAHSDQPASEGPGLRLVQGGGAPRQPVTIQEQIASNG